MKKEKNVTAKNIEKKSKRQKGVLITSRLKAGGFWEDIRASYGMKSS